MSEDIKSKIWDKLPEFFKKALPIVITLFLIYIAIIIAFNIHSGKPTKFLSFEFNTEIKHDTLVKIKNITILKDTCKCKPEKIIYRSIQDNIPKAKSTTSENSHTIIGNGNNVGVNGDVNYNQDIHLPESEQKEILDALKKLKNDNNLSKDIKYTIVQGGDVKFYDEFAQLLKNNGYTIHTILALDRGTIKYGIESGLSDLDGKKCIGINVLVQK